MYPEHIWESDRFANKLRGFWNSLENQKNFIEKIAKKLGIQPGDLEAWYKVATSDVIQFGGGSLLPYHGYSLARLIMAIYPEHEFDPTKFPRSQLAKMQEPAKVVDDV